MKRLCLVVDAASGVHPDVTASTTDLAGALAGRGHEVTVLVTDERPSNMPAKTILPAPGTTVERIVPTGEITPEHLKTSYLVYQHLKQGRFDTIVFPDCYGSGFASIIAKRTGLAFGSTELIVVTHGPTEWIREANQELKVTARDLAVGHMERTAVEGADMVVGPSAYLHSWMVERGWRLGERRAPVPYITYRERPEVNTMSGDSGTPGSSQHVERVQELVFPGPLEHRDGVSLYVRALNLVSPELFTGVTLTFWGRGVTYTPLAIIERMNPAVRTTADLRFGAPPAALSDYLRQPGRLAVMPWLDANSPRFVYDFLEGQIPFIAAGVGGVPELIEPADRARCLFEPNPPALADFLSRILAGNLPAAPVRPAFHTSASLAAWEEIIGSTPSRSVRGPGTPLVSVVVPHRDRPSGIRQTLESLNRQAYPQVEVVVVDDGSTTRAAQEALEHIEEEQWRHPLRVIRQPNRFPGAARNTGVREARGDLLLFIDDDDIAEPDYVAVMADAIQGSGADAVTCGFLMFENQDGPPGQPARTQLFLGGSLPVAVISNEIGGAGLIMRRSAWEAVGGFHEHLGLGLEDWDILVRMLLRGLDVISIPEALYWYRLSPHGVNASMDRYRSHQMVLQRFRDALPPALRSFADLIHGQALYVEHNSTVSDLRAAIDLRERYEWLLERRTEMLEGKLQAPVDRSPPGG